MLNISDAAQALCFLGLRLDESEQEVRDRLNAVIRAQDDLSRAIDNRDAFLSVFVKTAEAVAK